MLQKFKAWLIKQLSAPEKVAAPAQSTGATSQIEHETAQHVVPYDENLLERSRTQWQFGDWESLAKLERDTLQHHPDRSKLALLAAAGHLQQGNSQEARQFTRLAQDWGCSKKLISQILISGVHNSLGRAAAVSGQAQRALQHFQSSLQAGAAQSEVRLLTQARVTQQLSQLGLPLNTLQLQNAEQISPTQAYTSLASQVTSESYLPRRSRPSTMETEPMNLPNWLGIGSGRAGTTKMWKHLNDHPDIYLPEEKETHFFSRYGKIDELAIRHYSNRYFSKTAGQKAVGEISPSYLCPERMSSAQIAKDIRKWLGPDIRFIVNLRHPVHRAFSEYLFGLKSGWIRQPFCHEISDGKVTKTVTDHPTAYYFNPSFYGRDVANFVGEFGLESFEFVVMEEDFGEKIESTFARLCSHIGVAPAAIKTDSSRINTMDELEIIIPERAGELTLSSSGCPDLKAQHVLVDDRCIVIKTGWFPWDSVMRCQDDATLETYRSISKTIEHGLTNEYVCEVYERLFAEDVERLEELIGRDLGIWKPL
jgi:hypothetical protein